MKRLIILVIVMACAANSGGAKTKERFIEQFDSPRAMCDYVAQQVVEQRRTSKRLRTMLSTCTYLIVGDYLGPSQETIFETQPIDEREVELY